MVMINNESLQYFHEQRIKPYARDKVGELYPFHSPSRIFPGQNFISKDIRRAIREYDITPHLKQAREVLSRLSGIEHSGLKTGIKSPSTIELSDRLN
jgi:hypothetical protein